MSAEAIAARNSRPWIERQLSLEQVTHHRLKVWGLSKITGLGLGIFAGLAGALAVLVSGVLDFFLLPDRWARRYAALTRTLTLTPTPIPNPNPNPDP